MLSSICKGDPATESLIIRLQNGTLPKQNDGFPKLAANMRLPLDKLAIKPREPNDCDV